MMENFHSHVSHREIHIGSLDVLRNVKLDTVEITPSCNFQQGQVSFPRSHSTVKDKYIILYKLEVNYHQNYLEMKLYAYLNLKYSHQLFVIFHDFYLESDGLMGDEIDRRKISVVWVIFRRKVPTIGLNDISYQQCSSIFIAYKFSLGQISPNLETD